MTESGSNQPLLFLTFAAVSIFLVAGCSSSAPSPEEAGVIRPGGGENAELARKLTEGKLNQHLASGPRGSIAEGVEEEAPSGDAGVDFRRSPPMRPAPAAPPRAEPTAPRSGEFFDNGGDGDIRGRVESGFNFAAGAESPEKKSKAGGATRPGDAPATGQWKRSRHRPSFARVYVGGGNSLELVRMRVTVKIEGARARTVVDHIFRNPHEKQLEGTFEYPLPANASASYYAMFLTGDQRELPRFFPGGPLDELPPGVLANLAPPEVTRRVHRPTWGALREARVVHREKGRRVYEEITRRKIDPALLEYAGGNTFRGRVFPIEPKGLSRVIIAYEEHLDFGAGNSIRYRFALPDCDLDLLHVTATLPEVAARADRWAPEKGVVRRVADGRIVYEQAWEKTKGPGGELVLAYQPSDPVVQATAGLDPTRKAGAVYYARVRPELPVKVKQAWAERAVFLLDTSMSEHPDRFNAGLAILRRILEQDDAIRHFNVMCFDVGAWWVAPDGWLENDAAGRKRALDRLDRVLLEGATDLGGALERLARTEWDGARENVNVFLLTDGQVNWGEPDSERLLAEFEAAAPFAARFYCYRTGLGAENLELFQKLTRKGGGIFNVFDEAMAARAALAHRRPCLLLDQVRVDDGKDGAARDVLVAGRRAAVYPGGELVVAWRDDRPGEAAIEASAYRIRVTGRFESEGKEFEFPVRIARPGELAPRAWAEIAVNQMLAAGDPAVEPLAVAYAQRFHIGSRVTSFLVLEKDSDYREFGIAEEASKLEATDVGRFLADLMARGIEVVPQKEAFLRFLERVGERTGLSGGDKAAHVRVLATLLAEEEFRLPAGATTGALPEKSGADAGYLEAREKSRRDVNVYLDEAARRKGTGGAFESLRTLSTVVELHPGRSDALRLVGYRLLSLNQAGPAVRLFDRVRENRPFEPHSYRDLARSLEAAGRPGLAAIYYELILAGTWHARFHDSLKTVVLEEYCRTMRAAIRDRTVKRDVVERFGDRLEELASTATAADLNVTISWNTDNTDVDLWVVDPTGEACGYNHKKTKMGGELLDDLTGGYGPERFRLPAAAPGDYAVLVHYYSTNPNLLAGETHVDLVVTRKAGSPEETTRRFQVILKKAKQGVEVCRVRF